MDQIENILRSVDIKDQAKALASVIDETVKKQNSQAISNIFNRLLRDDVPPQVSDHIIALCISVNILLNRMLNLLSYT
jgi:formate dehydrogenase maturation protein FdhE